MSTLERSKNHPDRNRELRTKTERIIPEELNFGVWIWYSVENRMLFSESFYRMMGIADDVYPTFELLIESICPDDVILFLGEIEKILQDSKSSCIKFRISLSDNSIRTIQCYMEVMRNEFADVFDITGVCFEIYD